MINFEALFKVSYGLYIVSSGDRSGGNGFVSNTVFQVTATPARFASCCNKDNHTAGVIHEKGVFSVSVLHQDASPEIIGRFGYRSGRDLDKMAGMNLCYGETGVPVVLNDCVAWLEFKVVQEVDVGTHILFIGELVQAVVTDDSKEPLTYSYYRKVKKGIAPKNAPTYVDKSKLTAAATRPAKRYKCNACGFVYDDAVEKTPFADLPADWVCPVCGSEKTEFTEENL
jgi:flavin reductase (DIM6/NTAB) family NADH-FMN oxidoreductase RutF/rubredoxin